MVGSRKQHKVSVEEEDQVTFESSLLCSANSQMGEMKFNLGDMVHDVEIRPKDIEVQIEKDGTVSFQIKKEWEKYLSVDVI